MRRSLPAIVSAILLACLLLPGFWRPGSTHAEGNADVSLVSFKGQQFNGGTGAMGYYDGWGEVKNTSARDVNALQGTATLYSHGVSVASAAVKFALPDARAGEAVPFELPNVEVDKAHDVDDVKFTFSDQAAPAPIYAPALSFQQAYMGQPASGAAYEVTGKLVNTGKDNLSNVVAVATFYDNAGRITGYDTVNLFKIGYGLAPNTPVAVLNAGLGVNAVFFNSVDSAASYKILFRATPVQEESQLLKVTSGDVTWSPMGEQQVSGTLTNPSNRNIAATTLILSVYRADNTLFYVMSDYFHDPGQNALTLGPGESKPFTADVQVRGIAQIARVEVVALSNDHFPASAGSPQGGDSRYFSETKHTVSGRFLQYWNANGGLAQQGYPLSEPLREVSPTDGKTYTVQYFERAVFELHPENQPPNDVLLSLLGRFLYKAKYPNGAPGQVVSTDNPRTFPQTGHTIGGKFRQYWESHGGLAQQGYPISDEFKEVSAVDGKTYTVQYFERAVFELHTENAGTPYEVLLSLLGKFRYREVHPATL